MHFFSLVDAEIQQVLLRAVVMRLSSSSMASEYCSNSSHQLDRCVFVGNIGQASAAMMTEQLTVHHFSEDVSSEMLFFVTFCHICTDYDANREICFKTMKKCCLYSVLNKKSCLFH